MIEALNFIKGSVSSKDLIPELQHVQIKDGRITGFNGTLSLSSPVDLPNAVPKADTFIKALKTAEKLKSKTTVTIKENKLKVKSGKFTAYVDCLEEWNSETILPQGEKKKLTIPILPVAKNTLPFISLDPSRPWSRGVLFRNNCAYATNNVCLIQMYTGITFSVILPIKTIKELVRIDEEPTHVSTDGNTFTFYYEKDRWLRSAIIDGEWPNIEKIFETHATDKKENLPENFFDNVKQLIPFADTSRNLFLEKNKMSTSSRKKTGTSFDIEFDYEAKFDIDHMLLLKDVATHIDFSTYPNPSTFFGNKLRGLIVGKS